ncbi:MAG: carbohydrate-binding domain-containing protein [Clostridia bacterium]|nr:carbohydrate-binding domain-containing protein [Clostridia bacterium]
MLRNKIVLGVVSAIVAASMAIGLAACSECEHEWNDGVVTTEGTCQTTGIMTYTCTICGATKEEPYLGEHNWGDGQVTKTATCGADGEMTYTCSVCRKTKTETIDATGEHVWTENGGTGDEDGWETTLEPETNADGEQSRTCTVCGKTEIRSIAAATNSNHDFSEAVYYPNGVATASEEDDDDNEAEAAEAEESEETGSEETGEEEETEDLTQPGWYVACNHYGCDYIRPLEDDDIANVTFIVDSEDLLSSVLADANNDSNNTYSIRLDADIEATEAITVSSSSSVVLDLNGYAVTAGEDVSADSLVTVNGALTIQDTSRKGNGSISYDGTVIDAKAGTLTISGGSYTGESAVVVVSGATATISGGTFTGADDSTSATIQTAGTTTISGGKFTSDTSYVMDITGGTVDLTYGTFTATESSAVSVSGEAKLTIEANEDGTNSDVTITSNAKNGIEVNGGTFVMNSGTVTSKGANSSAVGIYESGTVTVNGGKIKSSCIGISTNGLITEAGKASVTITGGTITASSTGVYLAGYGTYEISGGTISGAVGVEIRAGELTISETEGSDTTISASRSFSLANNGEGNAYGPAVDSGAALAIVQHTTGLAIKVTVSGGLLSGAYSVYENNLQGNTEDEIAKIEIDLDGSASLKGDVLLADFPEEEEEDTTEEDGNSSTEGDATDDESSSGDVTDNNSSATEGTDAEGAAGSDTDADTDSGEEGDED